MAYLPMTKISIVDNESGITASIRPITATDTQGALDIHDKDNHRTIVQAPFVNYTGTTATPSVDIVQDDKIITFTSHPFIVGDFVKIFSVTTFDVGVFEIVASNATSITLNRPIDHSYVAAGTIVEKVIIDMNVDGSVVPVEFEAKIKIGKEIHLEEVVISATSGGAGAPDGTKFINQPALENGIILRQIIPGTPIQKKTLFTWQKNQDLFLYCRNTPEYTTGTFEGINALWSPKESADVVLNLVESNSDKMIVVVQDNIAALTDVSIRMMASWHYTDE